MSPRLSQRKGTYMVTLYTYYRKTVGGIALLKLEVFKSEDELLEAVPYGRPVGVLDDTRYTFIL